MLHKNNVDSFGTHQQAFARPLETHPRSCQLCFAHACELTVINMTLHTLYFQKTSGQLQELMRLSCKSDEMGVGCLPYDFPRGFPANNAKIYALVRPFDQFC